MRNHRMEWTFACLAVFICIFLSGCGPKGPKTAEVSGSLSWQGKPVSTGVVTLYSKSTGQGASADVGTDGTFHFSKVIVGPYQVSVEPPPLIIPDAGEKPKPVPPFPVPEKYHDGQSSGLTFEVKADEANTLTLDLK